MGAAATATGSWQCSVCGYVHRGAEPPEVCPICGVGRSEFIPCAEAAPAEKRATRRWSCLNCSHAHSGDEPPAECPVCGAPAARFEPAQEPRAGAGLLASRARVVVVGAGIAGVSAVESVRRVAPEAEITLLSREAELPYYRLNLTRLLAGEIVEDALTMHPPAWYRQQGVELLTGVEVSSLALDRSELELRGGTRLPFERLILALGAHPFVPPLPGANLRGVVTLRTRDDAARILRACEPGTRIVCVGGGLLGIEFAGGLARRGLDVALLEGYDWLMPRQLNRTAGDILAEHVTQAGIRLRTRARPAELLGDERVAGVLLEDGETLPADLVVMAAGVRPNSYLARRAGLDVAKGVVVGNRLNTSHPDVFAAGDVAEHRGELYGSWGAARYQGAIAGLNAAGLETDFAGLPRSNALKVLGLDLVSIGRFEPEDGSFTVVEEARDGRYLRFVFRDGVLVGTILLGDTAAAAGARHAVERTADFSGVLERHPSVGAVVEALRG